MSNREAFQMLHESVAAQAVVLVDGQQWQVDFQDGNFFDEKEETRPLEPGLVDVGWVRISFGDGRPFEGSMGQYALQRRTALEAAPQTVEAAYRPQIELAVAAETKRLDKYLLETPFGQQALPATPERVHAFLEEPSLAEKAGRVGKQVKEAVVQTGRDLGMVGVYAAAYMQETVQEVKEIVASQRQLSQDQKGVLNVVKGEAEEPVSFWRRQTRWTVDPDGRVTADGKFLEGWEKSAARNLTFLFREEKHLRSKEKSPGILSLMRKMAVLSPDRALDLEELYEQALVRRRVGWIAKSAPMLGLAACGVEPSHPAVIATVDVEQGQEQGGGGGEVVAQPTEAAPEPTPTAKPTQTFAPAPSEALAPTSEPTREAPVWSPPTLDQARSSGQAEEELPPDYLPYAAAAQAGLQGEFGPLNFGFYDNDEAGDDYRWVAVGRNARGEVIWGQITERNEWGEYPLYYSVTPDGLFIFQDGINYDVVPGSQGAEIVWGGSDGTLPVLVKEKITLADGTEVFALHWDVREGVWKLNPGLGTEGFLLKDGIILEVRDGQLVPVSGVEAGGVDRIERTDKGKVVAVNAEGRRVLELSGNEWVNYQPEYGYACWKYFSCDRPEVQAAFERDIEGIPLTYVDGTPVPWGVLGSLEGTTDNTNVFVHGFIVAIHNFPEETAVIIQMRVPLQNGDFIDIFVNQDNYTNRQINTYGSPIAGLPTVFNEDAKLTWEDVAANIDDPAKFESTSLQTQDVAQALLQNPETFIGTPILIGEQLINNPNSGIYQYNEATTQLLKHIRNQDASLRIRNANPTMAFKIFLNRVFQLFK